jgi:cAMP-dependent protein kinase regulator
MTRTYVEAGDVVIREGDAGDHFFVVEAGRFVATRAARPSEAGVAVGENGTPATPTPTTITLATYDGRGAFGELALLYGSPRAATVTAATAGVLWAMDRPAFRATLLRLRSARRAAVEASLSASPLLAALSPEARAAVADCVASEEYEDGAVILAQGEPVTPGSKLYFVESGTVVCTSRREVGGGGGGSGNDGEGGGEAVAATTTTTVGPGGWFGEVALVEPAASTRAADCIAAGRVRLLALGRDAFERVMGPAEAALGASVAAYREMNAAADAAGRAAKQNQQQNQVQNQQTAPASPAPLPPPDYAPLVSGPAVVKEAGGGGGGGGAVGASPRRGSAEGGGRVIGKAGGGKASVSSGYGQRAGKAVKA